MTVKQLQDKWFHFHAATPPSPPEKGSYKTSTSTALKEGGIAFSGRAGGALSEIVARAALQWSTRLVLAHNANRQWMAPSLLPWHHRVRDLRRPAMLSVYLSDMCSTPRLPLSALLPISHLPCSAYVGCELGCANPASRQHPHRAPWKGQQIASWTKPLPLSTQILPN